MEKVRQRQGLNLVTDPVLICPHQLGLGQAEASSWELAPILPDPLLEFSLAASHWHKKLMNAFKPKGIIIHPSHEIFDA